MVADAFSEALEALEWGRLLKLAEEQARSLPGQAKLRLLADPRFWAASVENAVQMQQETAELASLLDKEALWGPLRGLGDPAEPLDSLARGRVASLEELVLFRAWLYAVDSWE